MAPALDRMASLPKPVVYATLPGTDSLNPPSSRALSIRGEKSPPPMWTVPDDRRART